MVNPDYDIYVYNNIFNYFIMKYFDFTSKISGFPTSWPMLISIGLCLSYPNDYDISVNNYVFNYLLRNILILLPKYLAFLHLGQSRWEDKVAATKISGSSTLTNTLLRGPS